MKTTSKPPILAACSAALIAVITLLASFLASVGTASALLAPGGPLMNPGVAALTCAPQKEDASGAPVPPTSSYSFALVDLRNPNPSDYAPLSATSPIWNPPMMHHPDWTAARMGLVFGLAIDADGDIYVAANSLYDPHYGIYFSDPYLQVGSIGQSGGATDAEASGTIYKVDRMTGNATVFARLPQQADPNMPWSPLVGPGVGNIAYDHTNDQFFATNLEDGKIYRIDNAGTIVQSYDPGAPDNGAPGMPTFGDNVWGIGVANGGVYYAFWKDGSNADPAVIHRVDINGSGALVPSTDALVLTAPGVPSASSSTRSTPVSDIAFSADGRKMHIAFRGHSLKNGDFYTTLNHMAPVMLAQVGIVGWSVTNQVATGNNASSGEGYGGVDYGIEDGDPEKLVWMSSGDMLTFRGPHGIQGMRESDMPVALAKAPFSYIVPYDPGYTAAGPDVKSIGGDVEIMRDRRDGEGCKAEVTAVECPRADGAPFTAKLQMTNYTNVPAHYVILNPCPVADLPPGAVTLAPSPTFTTLSPPIANGASEGIEIGIPGSSGDLVCFLVTMLDASGEACCTRKVCVELPPCDCIEYIDQRVDCEILADGRIKYTIEVKIANRSHLDGMPFDFAKATLLPGTTLVPGLDPNRVEGTMLTPGSISPGASGTVKFCYYSSPGRVYTNLVLHDDTLENCCSLEDLCIELPDCGGGKPDECRVTQRVACWSPLDVAPPVPGSATITYTICNNSTVPRVYSWNASGFATIACPTILPDANFSPGSGTIGPVAPGDCATVTINIRCEGLEPGECANFMVCATPISPVATGERICCRGQVYRPDGPIIVDPPVDPPICPPGEWVPVCYVIKNDSSVPKEVILRCLDSRGVLKFATTPGGAADFILDTAALTIAPRDERKVIVYCCRVDEPTPTPEVIDIICEVVPTDGSPSVSVVSPAVLTAREEFEVAAVMADFESVGFVPSPPLVTLEFETELGFVYQLHESADCERWSQVPCQVNGIDTDSDGMFLGTGGTVTVYLPCDFEREKMFYRAELKN